MYISVPPEFITSSIITITLFFNILEFSDGVILFIDLVFFSISTKWRFNFFFENWFKNSEILLDKYLPLGSIPIRNNSFSS